MKVGLNRRVKTSIGSFARDIILIFHDRELTCNNHSRLEQYLGRDYPMLKRSLHSERNHIDQYDPSPNEQLEPILYR